MIQASDIENYLRQGLPCEHLHVAGDGAHWEAVIVSTEFAGKNRVQRQQRVYQVLGERLQSGEIHALSFKTLTPEEWMQKNG